MNGRTRETLTTITSTTIQQCDLFPYVSRCRASNVIYLFCFFNLARFIKIMVFIWQIEFLNFFTLKKLETDLCRQFVWTSAINSPKVRRAIKGDQKFLGSFSIKRKACGPLLGRSLSTTRRNPLTFFSLVIQRPFHSCTAISLDSLRLPSFAQKKTRLWSAAIKVSRLLREQTTEFRLRTAIINIAISESVCVVARCFLGLIVLIDLFQLNK